MAGIKHRQRVVSGGGLIFGSACINCPSALGDGVVVGTVAVSGLTADCELFITPVASLTAGMALLSACSDGTNISASFINSGSADVSASADVKVYYLAMPG
jgi:hypothetical protein